MYDFLSKENNELVERYPFLLLRNLWVGDVCEVDATELDNMPQGWREAFGTQMCEEIREALIKANYLDDYRISQIKEKYGGLRWYDFGATDEVHDIIYKYERLSERICIKCGKPATRISQGWICPYCDDCGSDRYNYVPIDEWFKGEE